MGLLGFSVLKCPECKGTEVVAVTELIWQKGKGTASRPKGYRCLGCNKPFNNAAAIADVQADEAREKIKELEANGGV